MKKILLLMLAMVSVSSLTLGQLDINTLGTAETIDFTGFNASGFAPTPSAGQLDSDTWIVSGLSDGSATFGSTKTTGDFARGTSNGGVSQGGVYAFNNGSTGVMLGVQPTGSDFASGSFTLKIHNNTGSVIGDLDLSYVIWIRNDQGRGNSFNFSHSSTNSAFTSESSLDYTSPAASSGSAWTQENRNITLTGVNIPVGGDYYLKWTGDDVTGGGSRDEFGIDDISITGQAATPPPTISVSPASLTGFTYAEGSGPSTEQSFTVSGTDLTNDITVTAPANYEISETSGSGFTNTITLTQSSGAVASTTIYVRLSAGLTAAGSPYNQTITASSTGATTQDVDVEGTVTAAPTPVITASPMSLTGFTYAEGSGPSAEQSFDVEGSDLSADIILSAPTNYEISETSGSGFTNTITLTQSSGTVASTTIYVRLKSSLTAASSPFNEMVTITSSGALDVEVDLEGTVTVTTNVTVSETSLTGFSYMQSNGGPSNFQSFNVGGAGLSGDITITAPANYEISATSGSGYTNSIDLSPVTGTVSATTIYVRLKGGLMASGSPYNEDVTISSAGVSDQTVTLEGEVINDVGIGEASENEFSVYPNPFNQQFTIISNQKDVTVVITDVLGKVVYTNTNIKDKTVVQIDVPSGIYFVTLTSGDNAITKKLIKK